MDYFLFIDESGSPSFDQVDPGFPVFTLCGTILSNKEYELFDRSIITMKRKFWNTKNIILHSSEIAAKKGSFEIFKEDKPKFSEFIRDMNTLITSTDFKILSTSIKKDKYRPSKIPNIHRVYSMSLEFILERTIHFMRTTESKNRLKIIIERRGAKEDKILEAEFCKLIKNGNVYWKPKEFAEFTPSIHFRHKNENINGLQLADLCAYPIAKYVIDSNKPHPSFPYLEPKIYCVEGNCYSYGLKVFP